MWPLKSTMKSSASSKRKSKSVGRKSVNKSNNSVQIIRTRLPSRSTVKKIGARAFRRGADLGAVCEAVETRQQQPKTPPMTTEIILIPMEKVKEDGVRMGCVGEVDAEIQVAMTSTVATITSESALVVTDAPTLTKRVEAREQQETIIIITSKREDSTIHIISIISIIVATKNETVEGVE